MNAIEREQFLAERRTGIGSSDVPKLAGVSSYGGPAAVYAEKVLDEHSEQSDAMLRGVELEPYLRIGYELAQGRVAEPGTLRRHPGKPWAIAHLDAEVDGGPIVEIKTATDPEPWRNGVRVDYMMQVQWQLFVSQCEKAEVAVSIAHENTFRLLRDMIGFGVDDERIASSILAHTDFRIIPVARDEEMIAALVATAEPFWLENVVKRVPPTPTTTIDARRLWPVHAPAKRVEASEELYGLILSLPELKAKQKALADERERIEALCMAEMGDAELLTINDVPQFAWRTVERKAYTVEASTSRRFGEATKKDRGEK